MESLKLISIKDSLGSAEHRKEDTLVIATIKSSSEKQQIEFLKISWFEGNDLLYCEYYAFLLEKIFFKFLIPPPFERKYVLNLWVSPGKFTLQCAINAAMLAILDAGLPIENILCGVQNQNSLYVYKQSEIVFLHNFGPVDQSKNMENDAIKILEKFKFEIENKFNFEF